jgi:hypothetical protein
LSKPIDGNDDCCDPAPGDSRDASDVPAPPAIDIRDLDDCCDLDDLDDAGPIDDIGDMRRISGI